MKNMGQNKGKTEQNKGHISYKVKKICILKRDMCNFCEYVFFMIPPKILEHLRVYQQKNKHSNVGFF